MGKLSKGLQGAFLTTLLILLSGSMSNAANQVTLDQDTLYIEQGQIASAQIEWTSNYSNAQVYVSSNGGAEKLYAQAPSGIQTIPWFTTNKVYTFRLYANTDKTLPLDEHVITTLEPHGEIFLSESNLYIPKRETASLDLNWNSGGYETTQVYVSINGGSDSLVAQGVFGSQIIPWFVANKTYTFKLYAETDKTILLDQFTVTTSESSGELIVPITKLSIPSGETGSTTLNWSTVGYSNAQIYVSVNGGNESLVAQGSSGEKTISWLAADNQYIFKLYGGTNQATLLDEHTIQTNLLSGILSVSDTHLDIFPNYAESIVLSWDLEGINAAHLFVSVNGNSESLVASMPSYTLSIPWIVAPNTYTFCLYADLKKTTLLDEVVITTAVASHLNLSRYELAIPEDTRGSISVNWDVPGHPNATIFVQRNNFSENLFASGMSGSVNAPWLWPGDSYTFNLYNNVNKDILIESKVIHTTEIEHTLSAYPVLLDSTEETTVTWSTGLGNAKLYLVNSNGSILIDTGNSGSTLISNLDSDEAHRFYLYNEDETKILELQTVYGENAVPSFKANKGGANFPIFDYGDYIDTYMNHPNDPALQNQSWFSPGNMKLTIGLFHEDDEGVIETTLTNMISESQTQVLLPLWFGPINSNNPKLYEGCYGHLLNSALGHLEVQHKENLLDLLEIIEDLEFERVIIRFAPQGSAQPKNWQTWKSDTYNQNWSFMTDVIQTTLDQLNNSNLEVLFDLGIEMGGLNNGKTQEYNESIWTDYTTNFPLDKTIGFSFAVGQGRILDMYETYNTVGVLPSFWAFDVYGAHFKHDDRRDYKLIARELAMVGEIDKPILITETNSNDVTSKEKASDAFKKYGFVVDSFSQWPIFRSTRDEYGKVHFSEDAVEGFSNYLELIEQN